ncbi:DUF4476 domain-containing protein [Rufibacter glacialis]|uniref:DUF4476 domain-containing protein n=1 Tax=Rufibacter glacialis TaxID=1259555 RepID=A0A5M8QEG2_9BACT|nr:DUF4476 domain-containing protein [Rufibacter glacialis]KAA6433481.1 DUF4476 domain-containing protein [Rufibacter glacialis]GGK73838.1 hypothetical protein GCM10011405_22370 [Rufibacter glacialis]
MKRFYFLGIFFLLLGHALSAQPALDAALLVETQRGEYFQLNIGGRLINVAPSSRVAVADLPAGRHMLNIRVLGRGRRAQNITAEVLLERGYEGVYVLAPAVAGRAFPLVLRKVDQVPLSRPLPPAQGNDVCRYTMEEQDVERVLRFMKEEGFDDRRLEIAKGEIKLAGGLMTEDLFLLMKALSFEERRVALAKFAYGYVCDPQRFSRVLDALEFSSSKRELQDFLYKR